MPKRRARSLEGSQRLAFFLLVALLVLLWIAGGASRGDALGQTFCRAAAWMAVLCSIFFLPAPNWRSAYPVTVLYGCAVALVVLQLVPVPPSVWAAIPGRAMLALPSVAGIDPGWQPLTISRAASLNALWSLVVPGAILALMAGLPNEAHQKLIAVLLILIFAACILALAQFSGAQFDHPLINDRPGDVGGPFANRNHFALFAALGTILAPALAFSQPASHRWISVTAAVVWLLCVVMILAVGSRGGFVVGLIGAAAGLVMVRRDLAAVIRRFPRKIVVSFGGAAAAILCGTIVLSIFSGRAQSLVRLQDEGAAAGLRGAIRPTVYHMIGKYFPFGSGFGTFDPAYRIEEPTRLIGLQYVNQAHNDLLQVALDGGLLGALLLLAALGWSVRAGWRAWRPTGTLEGRTASAMLLLIVVASAVDYPVRTPIIMAVTMMSAVWLARSDRRKATEVDGGGLYR